MKRIEILLTISLLAMPRAAIAECDFQSTETLAEILTLQQRHREAELEYERLAASCTEHSQKTEALARMMDAALLTQDYAFSLKLSRAWLTQLRPPESCSILLGEAKSLYGLNNDEAVLRQGLSESCPVETREQLIFVQGLSHLRLHQWAEASKQFVSLRNSATLKTKAQIGEDTAARGQAIGWKSPATAAGLSVVIPGSGYWYARKPQTASAAFIVTGLFIGGTYSAAHAKEPALAALLGLFSFAWYFGGIRGSAEAVRHTNRFDMQRLIEPIDIL